MKTRQTITVAQAWYALHFTGERDYEITAPALQMKCRRWQVNNITKSKGEDDYSLDLKRFDHDLGEEVEHMLHNRHGNEQIITVTVTPLQAQMHL